MSQEIKFTDLAIQELFQKFYIIPAYQREYVWGENEVNQLMDDLIESFYNNPKSEYFLGSLVVCKLEGTHKYEVIDGQQRLITLSLLLNNLRRIYLSNGENYSTIERFLFSGIVTETGETVNSYIIDVQYEGKEVLYDLYRTKDDNEISNSTAIEGLPGETIYNAHKAIALYLDTAFSQVEKLEIIKKFLGYLLNKVKLIQIQTPEIGNALKIFETINERGVSLDQVDLLKNLLFIQIERKEFHKLKDEWNKFKTSIVGKKIKEKPLRFLRYFIMANYEVGKDEKSDRIVREDDIYQWFINNEKKCGYKADPFGFIKKIQENAEFYINLVKGRYRDENNVNLENIHKLVGSGFKQHFVLLLSAQNLKPELFDHLVKQLEVLLFYYNITKEPPRDIEKRFANWAVEIRTIRSSEGLNDFISNRIGTDLEHRRNAFEYGFLNLNYNSLQTYKLKYILAKLSSYVDQAKVGDLENRSLASYFRRSIQIEHILPDNPTKDVILAFNGGDEKEYNQYKHKLGNLTLLERPINASIQRGFFPEKCKEYEKSAFYLTKSISRLDEVGTNTSINRLNQYLKNFSQWNKDVINERQKMLYELSKLTWQIELFSK